MTEYRSRHKGQIIDNTIDTVIDHEAIIKYGHIEGNIANQTDLYNAIDSKVNKTTTVNGKALRQNITLNFSDVGALSDSTPLATSLGMNDLTISIKDQDGNVMSEQTVPTYNSTTIDSLLDGRANRDLSNLTTEGEAHFANHSLSNLNFEGENHFPNLSLSNLSNEGEDHFRKPLSNCIISGHVDWKGSLDLIDGTLYTVTKEEYTQPGSNSFTVSTSGYYTIELVGGGGGGARNATDNTHGFWCSGGSAGSGAFWAGTVRLNAGETVTISVGGGGSDVYTVAYTYATTGGAGGATVLYINNEEVVRCNGGGGGSCGYAASGGQVVISPTQSARVTTTSSVNGYGGSYQQTSTIPNIPRTKSVYNESDVGPGSGGGSYSGGYAGRASVSLEVEGSKEVRYLVTPESPLVIADKNANKTAFTGINPDIIAGLEDGIYNKFVGANGSDLLNGYVFKGIEPPMYYSKTEGINVENNIASGFSGTEVVYINKVMPFSEANSWNITLRVRYMLDSTSAQMLLNESTAGFQTRVGVDATGKLGWQISSNQNSGDIQAWAVGSTVLQHNEIYYIRMEFTGSAYNLLLSTTGAFAGEETTVLTKASTTKLQDLGWTIGSPEIGANPEQYWRGTVDMASSYIVVNGRKYVKFVPSNGDVWIQGGSSNATYKYEGLGWAEYDKVYIGSFGITNGNLVNIKNSYISCNNTEVNGQNTPFVVDSYKVVYSWYRLWSNGWLEQGGLIPTRGADTFITVNLLKPFKDTTYQVYKTLRNGNSWDMNSNAVQVTDRRTTSFKTWNSSGITSGQGFDWMAVGWAKDSIFSYNMQA